MASQRSALHLNAVSHTLSRAANGGGLEPYDYLKEVLTRLLGIKCITPAAMAAANEQTLLQAAL